MGFFSNWIKKSNSRREWIKEKIDQTMESSDEVRKQKIKSRENIAKEIISATKNNNSFICPYIQQPSSGDIIELIREPSDPTDQPFGLSKGTIRATIALFFTIGFLIITMMMIFLLPLTLDMIFNMWYVLAGVFSLIVTSYFYTRLKGNIGSLFKN